MRFSDGYFRDIDKVIEIIPNIKRLFNTCIAVSGASGLIGSAVVDTLLRLNSNYGAGIKIITIGRNRDHITNRFNYSNSNDYSFIEYDFLSNRDFDLDTDFFIHCAGICSPTLYLSKPVETIRGCISGLNVVLENAKKNNIKRVLFVSSSEVYGIKNNNNPFKESEFGYVNSFDIRSCYPCAKKAAESLCVAYAKEYEIDIVVARPGHIYGPCISEADDRVFAYFVRSALRHDNIILKSNGNQLRSYCYTLDCSSSILTVLCNGQKSNAYNVSNPNSIASVRDLAEEFASVAMIDVVYDIPNSQEIERFNMMNNSSLDSAKIEGLGWRGLFDLHEGVVASLAYSSHE